MIEVPSLVALAQSLKSAGIERPLGTAAHHIVARGARAAGPVRLVLQNFNIGINNAVNGILLPVNINSPNPLSATVHSTMHTKEYHRYVNEALRKATTAEQAGEILDFIKVGL